MLPDWSDYHSRLSVDHRFVFDNGAAVDIRAALCARRRDVDVMSSPWQKIYAQSFSYMLLMSRRRWYRLLKTDVGEFIMVGIGETGTQTQDAPTFLPRPYEAPRVAATCEDPPAQQDELRVCAQPRREHFVL